MGTIREESSKLRKAQPTPLAHAQSCLQQQPNRMGCQCHRQAELSVSTPERSRRRLHSRRRHHGRRAEAEEKLIFAVISDAQHNLLGPSGTALHSQLRVAACFSAQALTVGSRAELLAREGAQVSIREKWDTSSRFCFLLSLFVA